MFGLRYGNALHFGFRNFVLVSVPPEKGLETRCSEQVVDLRTAGNVSRGQETHSIKAVVPTGDI